MRTSALCLLVLLSVLATASRVQAQAVLNPNQISGHLAFANQNPEILNIFDRSGLDQGFSSAWVRADSIGITPPLNNHTYLQAENGTSMPYEITVESSAAGIAYRVTPWAYLKGSSARYYFESAESAGVTPEPNPDITVDITECAGVVDIGWVDLYGSPVAVQGFQIHALRESVSGSGNFNIGQAYSWLSSGNTSQTYLPVRGDGADYTLSIYYDSGTDPYSDKVRGLCNETLAVNCDEIVEVTCMIPPPGELGAIVGNVDMVGEEENPWGFVGAEYGPLRNRRYDLLQDPPSGPFALENLVVSAAEDPAKGYTVWGDIKLALGLSRGGVPHTLGPGCNGRRGANDRSWKRPGNRSGVPGRQHHAGRPPCRRWSLLPADAVPRRDSEQRWHVDPEFRRRLLLTGSGHGQLESRRRRQPFGWWWMGAIALRRRV